MPVINILNDDIQDVSSSNLPVPTF